MFASDPTQHAAVPELPSLEPGLSLLETDGETRGPLHALVVDRVLGGGEAYWVDAHGHATTRPLVRLAPTPRVLERIHVARGFTRYQHYAIVDALENHLCEETALIVVPALDGLYREECYRGEGEALLLRTLATLARYGREYDVPILATCARDDAVSAPIEAAAGDVVRCERTRQGPRFVADGFETLVYPAGRGQLQTTLAFWRRILAARQPRSQRAASTVERPMEVSAGGSY